MKRACAILLIILICVCFDACTIGNVEIVFEEDKKVDAIFSLGEYVSCTKEELAVYFLLAKSEYEEVFGEDVWHSQFKISNIPIEDFVKNNILAKAIEEKSMSALARHKGLSLSDDELEDISLTADKLYNSFIKDNEAISISSENVKSVLTDRRFAELAHNYITKDADTEISDAEAKVIEVRYIRCKLEGKDYSEVLELMDEIELSIFGSDFDKVIAQYSSQIESDTINVCRGQLLQTDIDGESVESKLFSLTTGDISDIIVVEGDAAYIFKSIDDYDPDKTEANKAVILEKRKDEIMQKEYNLFLESVEYVFNKEMWENLHFKEYFKDMGGN